MASAKSFFFRCSLASATFSSSLKHRGLSLGSQARLDLSNSFLSAACYCLLCCRPLIKSSVRRCAAVTASLFCGSVMPQRAADRPWLQQKGAPGVTTKSEWLRDGEWERICLPLLLVSAVANIPSGTLNRYAILCTYASVQGWSPGAIHAQQPRQSTIPAVS